MAGCLLSLCLLAFSAPPAAPLPAPPVLSRLTFAAEAHLRPVYSPRGRTLACIEIGQWGQRCLIVDRTGGTLAMAGEAGDDIAGAPSWSPDGRRVCWVTRGGELWILSVDGETLRIGLPDWGTPEQVVWQPTVPRALVGTTLGIYSVPIDEGGPMRRVKTYGGPGRMGPFCLSADGRSLAYIAGGAAYVTTSPESRGRLLGPRLDDGESYARVWLSDDGSHALLLREGAAAPAPIDDSRTGCRLDSGYQQLLLVDVRGVRWTEVDLGGRRITGADFGPDETGVGSAAVVSASGDLLLIDPLGRAVGVLLDDSPEDADPCFDPRGRNVIFSSLREPVRVTEPDQPQPNLFAVAVPGSGAGAQPPGGNRQPYGRELASRTDGGDRPAHVDARPGDGQ